MGRLSYVLTAFAVVVMSAAACETDGNNRESDGSSREAPRADIAVEFAGSGTTTELRNALNDAVRRELAGQSCTSRVVSAPDGREPTAPVSNSHAVLSFRFESKTVEGPGYTTTGSISLSGQGAIPSSGEAIDTVVSLRRSPLRDPFWQAKTTAPPSFPERVDFVGKAPERVYGDAPQAQAIARSALGLLRNASVGLTIPGTCILAPRGRPDYVIRALKSLASLNLTKRPTLRSAIKAFGLPTRAVYPYEGPFGGYCQAAWRFPAISILFGEPLGDLEAGGNLAKQRATCMREHRWTFYDITLRAPWRTAEGLEIGDPSSRANRLHAGAKLVPADAYSPPTWILERKGDSSLGAAVKRGRIEAFYVTLRFT
jgi:hypothetical protein